MRYWKKYANTEDSVKELEEDAELLLKRLMKSYKDYYDEKKDGLKEDAPQKAKKAYELSIKLFDLVWGDPPSFSTREKEERWEVKNEEEIRQLMKEIQESSL